MGTHSITRVIDLNGKEIINLYRQYDGYPSGMGQELADFLKWHEIVNGFGRETLDVAFNGAECMAAAIVAHFKTDIGNFYLYPPHSPVDTFDYTVSNRGGKPWVSVATEKKVLWEGFADDFDSAKVSDEEEV